MSLTKLSLAGISLIIPCQGEEMANLFVQCSNALHTDPYLQSTVCICQLVTKLPIPIYVYFNCELGQWLSYSTVGYQALFMYSLFPSPSFLLQLKSLNYAKDYHVLLIPILFFSPRVAANGYQF
jgi:hypothetical protein